MQAHKVEPIKRLVEKVTGFGVPTREEALASVRNIKPLRMKFRDDGYIPNNPKLPLLYYASRFASAGVSENIGRLAVESV